MLTGEVQIAEHLGGETFLYASLPSGETIVVEIQGQSVAKSGERVGIDFDEKAYHLFGGDGRKIGRHAAAGGTRNAAAAVVA